MVDLEGDLRVVRWEKSGRSGLLNECFTGKSVQSSLSRWVASSSSLELRKVLWVAVVKGGPGGVLPSLPHGPGEGPLGHHAQLPQPDEVAQAEVGGGGEVRHQLVRGSLCITQ